MSFAFMAFFHGLLQYFTMIKSESEADAEFAEGPRDVNKHGG